MILRKPYAIFIKYFKVIHLIMAVFMCLLILQTNSFLMFFNKYINSNSIAIGRDLVSEVFIKLTYIYIAIVLTMDVIVWILLEFKHKKRLLYVINFFGYVGVLTLYIYINSLLSTMGLEIVDTRLIMTVRDLVILCFSFQTLSVFITISRFLGFDIKKFDFENDLKELNITDTDNEEFEVNLNLDTKKIKRTFREHFRNFKYYVKENYRLIIPALIIAVGIISFLFYKGLNGNAVLYKQNVEFSIPNYRMNVIESFTTNNNYEMQAISEDNTLVILKVNLKTNNNTSQFVFGKFYLEIDENKYYHNINYTNDIKDIGNTYIKQKLTTDYQTFLLVYEIPSKLKNKKKQLVYVNELSSGIFKRNNITKVEIKTQDLDVEKKESVIKLDVDITLEKDLSNITSLKFKKIEIADVFKVKYKKCFSTYECIDFYEPLQADFYGSYDKALLKLEMDINNYITSEKHAEYINLYGKIKYKINNKLKVFDIRKEVLLQKVNSNSYFFEIPKEILDSDEIIFEFTTRNNKIIYKLR